MHHLILAVHYFPSAACYVCILKYICMNNRTCFHVCWAARRVCWWRWCVYGLCYPPSQWTGEDCGCNSQWLMFLLNGSVVVLSRLSADTMTCQSGWRLDWQTHTHTGTYISAGPQQAFLDHHYYKAGPWQSWGSICTGPWGRRMVAGQKILQTKEKKTFFHWSV